MITISWFALICIMGILSVVFYLLGGGTTIATATKDSELTKRFLKMAMKKQGFEKVLNILQEIHPKDI